MGINLFNYMYNFLTAKDKLRRPVHIKTGIIATNKKPEGFILLDLVETDFGEMTIEGLLH
ncbi:hypothetical protein [Clostridium beijerinckii]|uniref:hypothetical protein n=1 Tax=Clostridium beijerinckii TaxID=1520 RepID=UPI001F35253C|nr:hypothetical protein [Clostridium beijerinckii]